MYKPSTTSFRPLATYSLLAALLWALFVQAAAAHEPMVLPLKVGEKTRIVPLTTRHGHLSFASNPIDLGDVAVGSSTSAAFSVNNTTARDLTLVVNAPPDVTVTPSTLSLAAGATSAPLTVLWTPPGVATLDGTLTFTVSHTGVDKTTSESIGIVGQAALPARLRFDIPTFAESDVTGTDFGMASPEDDPTDAPTFEMTITNVGGLPARGVRAAIAGPGGTFDGLGVCQSVTEAILCINEKIGSDGNGNPIVEERADFGDLAPGASVTALWRIVPGHAGEVDRPYDFHFTTGGESTERIQTFDIAGEIISYRIPGLGFLKAGAGGGGKMGFGAPVDPLNGDALATLRPTGYDARTIFSVGEIDTVDLRTGALTLTASIGGAQVVRGPLAYELKAVFNSHLWKRQTLAQLTIDSSTARPRSQPLPGEYPDPIFNLGTGWLFSLGRLMPPHQLASLELNPTNPACPSNPLDFQKSVITGPRFVYIDAAGTQHEFWRQLHGEDETAGDTNLYANKPVLYSRDGSFLRLVLDPANANRRWVEEPSGIKRLFVKQSSPFEPTLPDEWLLQSIEDPYGNKVTITYGPNTWTIQDNVTPARTTTVRFIGWSGKTPRDPMLVSKVEMPGFNGGTPREYDFDYTTQSIAYPARSAFHTNLRNLCPGVDATVPMPRLDSITLPDGSRYTFTYDHPTDDRVRLESATLPTGATIDYQYAKSWDSPPDCRNGSLGSSANGVSRRTVTEAGGGVLQDRRYLREIKRTADVPNTICRAFNPSDNASVRAPFSEQTVAVWNAQESGLSTASIHYFNVYPFDDRCSKSGGPVLDADLCHQKVGTFWRLDSGRTHFERNLQISHSLPGDPLDSALNLSTETYSCNVSMDAISIPRIEIATGDQVGDDVSALTSASACAKRETTYADYEVSRAGHQCQQSSAHCMRTSRLRASRVVYHDDNDKWIKTVNSDNDGLGHYRRTVTRSNFETSAVNGNLEQTRYQNWNPGVGTLTLHPDHTVDTPINLPNRWLLETWDHHWTVEDGQGQGGEACFDPQYGHLTHSRTWETTSVNQSSVSANRRASDLVVSHEVDTSTGQLNTQRFFGADTFNVPVGTTDWCAANVWTAGNQDYAIENLYSHGVLSQQRVSGDSVFDLRQTIDAATGWPKNETRNSGEVVTFAYDEMGRQTWATSQRTASHHSRYQQQPDGRWKVTATVYPKGTTSATSAPSPIRIYDAAYDGLGRMRSETLPLYNDNPGTGNRNTVQRSVAYHKSGAIRSVTSLDAPNGPPTRLDYDFRGRVRRITYPNNSKSERQYTGVRKTKVISCVKTGTSTTSGICNGTGFEKAETVAETDWKGRTIKVKSPLDGDVPGNFETTFTYDPQDNRTEARRRHTEGGNTFAQARVWSYDGRGFMVRENIPEQSPTVFSDFTTRGLPRTVQEGGGARTLNHAYDRMGRLRRTAVGSRPLKRFVYCDPDTPATYPCDTTGSENGQLVAALRNNYRSASESGIQQGVTDVDGTWLVTSSFDYDLAGRVDHRATRVLGGADWLPNPTATTPITTFEQSWTYDDLGNVTALGYPQCDTPGIATCGSTNERVVHYGYRQGHFLTGVFEGTLGATFRYHASGLIKDVVHQGGAGTDSYGIAGGMPRIASINLGVGSGQSLNLGSLSYDFAGNITSIGSDTFSYDKNSRLAHANVRGTTRSYAYDNFDNLRNEGTGTPQDTGTVNLYTNQLQGTGTFYDNFGNLTNHAGFTLVYDELDKLAGLHMGAGGSDFAIYDHDDLRIRAWSNNNPAHPEVTWTLRNGLTVIREFVGKGNAMILSKDYVYAGSRRISSKSSPGNHERHYHEDQVGNARLITGFDPRFVHFEPFGESIGGTDSGERSVGFQGHENDGLVTYMRGRTYLPLSHRFLQVDPGRDEAAWSQYAFVGNNPMSHIDSTGLSSSTAPTVAPTVALRPQRRKGWDGIPVQSDTKLSSGRQLGPRVFPPGDGNVQHIVDARPTPVKRDGSPISRIEGVRSPDRKTLPNPHHRALKKGSDVIPGDQMGKKVRRTARRAAMRMAGKAAARVAVPVAVVMTANDLITAGKSLYDGFHEQSLEAIVNDPVSRHQAVRHEAIRDKAEKSAGKDE